MKGGGGNIKVVVRCRPLNAREIARGAISLVRMEGNQTILTKPPSQQTKSSEDTKAFTFDRSYWSADKTASNYADQQVVYDELGCELLDHAFLGYNCCIVAYGQTGSGKSYSMMGYGEDKGIIPRTCSELFDRIVEKTTSSLEFQVEVSYIEIYNEKVRDLLNPRNKGNLKVREHPSTGPYVEDLSRLAVNSFADIDHLMDEGNKARTVAATNMNETSSRSHAVFNIFLTQRRRDKPTDLPTEKVARISLVDLAGSERANSTGATGTRLKEGSNINKSLTTLGKVIAGLAEQSIQQENKKNGKKSKEAFVPFRDSILTWLLKDSLGGNSKTAMIAAISPADFDETLSTLRYADQAKKIKTKAVVNEDPNAKMIRELKDELQALKQTLMVYAPEERNRSVAPPKPETIVFSDGTGTPKYLTKQEMAEQVQITEKLLDELNETWDQKVYKTELIHMEREKSLEELGIYVEKNSLGVYTPKKIPHLVNLNEDPLMSECLMYQVRPGITRVEAPKEAYIRLSGTNILEEHCFFENEANIVTLHPGKDSLTMVNGMRILQPKRLKSGYRIILGDYHIFRFNHPEEARKERDTLLRRTSSLNGHNNLAISRPESPTVSIMSDRESVPQFSDIVDWNFARREAALCSYNTGENSTIVHMPDEDLERLFDDVSKVRLRRLRESSYSSSDGGVSMDTDSVSRRTSGSSYRLSTLSAASTFQEDSSVDESYFPSKFGPELTMDRNELFQQAKEEMQQQLELQRQEYESQIQSLSMNLLSRTSSVESLEQPSDYTEAEATLARKVIEQWKSHRYAHMTQVISRNTPVLQHANEMAFRQDEGANYRFIVIHDNTSVSSQSFWESSSSYVDAELLAENKPCIAVHVTDQKNKACYIWSVEKFRMRMRYMQGVLYTTDRIPKHLIVEEAFYDATHSRYSLLGLARTPLRNLAFQVPIESVLNVFCRNTGKSICQLKVLIAPIARSVLRGKSTAAAANNSLIKNGKTTKDHQANKKLLNVGQQLVFEVRMLVLSGLNEEEFTRVHAQFRLSAFGTSTRNSSSDTIFATEPIRNFGSSPVELGYSQTLSMTVTTEMLDAIMNNCITFEVFGEIQPDKITQAIASVRRRPKATASTTAASVVVPSRERTNRVNETRHDVLSWIQLCEMAPEGEYKPVMIMHDQGSVFSLRQGQQRRIILTLSHDSGNQLEWQDITSLAIGRIRLMDTKGRTADLVSSSEIPIKLMPDQILSPSTDGTSSIIVQGAWDSSLHDSLLLNRITPAGHRVVLTVSWKVRCGKHDEPLKFKTDIYVRILGATPSDQIKRASLFRNFFSGLPAERTLSDRMSSIFSVHICPSVCSPPKGLESDITFQNGHQDTENKTQSLELLDTYRAGHQRISCKEQASFMRHGLVLHEQILQRNGPVEHIPLSQKEKEALLHKVIKLWTFKPQLSREKNFMVLPMDKIPGSPGRIQRWSSEVHEIIPNSPVTMKGPLSRFEKDTGKWEKYWCVLRKPLLFLYKDQTEISEASLLRITSVAISDDAVQTPNRITVYTHNNSYLLQVNDPSSLMEWREAMDPLSSF
ncbi:hypothetical protein PHYBLDRAFT_135717 [Phycomyces blakesleeanus NRRL 1555(-)]|uniref:Kinesin-like protein n=1 Tax=Phycomyces blakesleeanus (strain ATCC 8743b / DSM 1359 / FGSC 10004 / NBRC 33097 / NRRL 1555) TaxID=763407 RepID=A0A167L554_PHYB8|nr:hypothetical protein PHYBLDRAFT_135717 [Phycomyces blakesleeanus NRRL 1555(-)]OAD69615.1 hypothetical protein PHYBLDRAFT_135717 [Phycomyces blakesleeanus NRRL 1555(-)]|eukprot:XP_018287655.1 hypothetical protein PHYBLDRAFT_135717 [Phycomyces blakesleeanus NRRL 1555(-)]